MASAFGHAYMAIALRSGFPKITGIWKFVLLGIFCAVIPDADVISFKLGIPYGSFWGHRGFTHSIVFALLLGFSITALFYRQQLKSKTGAYFILYFTLCTVSHGLLDAMTSGGLGVAFFSPFNDARYFFPWRPIRVSPIGAGKFFSEWGIRVLKSELIWIGIPCTVYMIVMKIIKSRTNSSTSSE